MTTYPPPAQHSGRALQSAPQPGAPPPPPLLPSLPAPQAARHAPTPHASPPRPDSSLELLSRVALGQSLLPPLHAHPQPRSPMPPSTPCTPRVAPLVHARTLSLPRLPPLSALACGDGRGTKRPFDHASVAPHTPHTPATPRASGFPFVHNGHTVTPPRLPIPKLAVLNSSAPHARLVGTPVSDVNTPCGDWRSGASIPPMAIPHLSPVSSQHSHSPTQSVVDRPVKLLRGVSGGVRVSSPAASSGFMYGNQGSSGNVPAQVNLAAGSQSAGHAVGVSASKSRTQPSRFCHVCSRTSKKVGLIACGNFLTGACRKVTCQKCFIDHGWDWQSASKTNWICTHCRQECPERAQCAIYKRTNERRREQQMLQRSFREMGHTGNGGPDYHGPAPQQVGHERLENRVAGAAYTGPIGGPGPVGGHGGHEGVGDIASLRGYRI